MIADAQDAAGEPDAEDEGDAPDIEDVEQPAGEAPQLTAALEVAGESALTAVANASAELGEPAYQWQKLEDAAEYTQRVVDGDIAGAEALWTDIEGANQASFDAQAALGEGYFAYSYRCVVTAGELRAVTESHRFPEPEAEIVEAEPVELQEIAASPDEDLQEEDGGECTHPSTVTDDYPRYADYIGDHAKYSAKELEEIGGHLNYTYCDPQYHVVRGTKLGRAEYCAECGKLISVLEIYPDGEQPTVSLGMEPHQYDENDVCTLCERYNGANGCAHRGATEYIIRGNFEPITDIEGEGGYAIETGHKLPSGGEYLYDEYCKTCKSWIRGNTHTAEAFNRYYPHDFVIQDGKKVCRLCGYEDTAQDSCDHPVDQLQISLRQAEDGVDYFEIGDPDQHMRVSPSGEYRVYCRKCEKNVPELEEEYSKKTPLDIYNSGVDGANIEDLLESHNNFSSDSNYCVACGGYYGCMHGRSVKQRVLATAIPSLGSATYEGLDKDWHAIHTAYYNKLYCAYCDAYLGMELATDESESNGAALEVTLLEKHSYDLTNDAGEPELGAVCSVCGYTYCAHPSWIRVYEADQDITPYDASTHTIPAGTRYHLVCADCGAMGKTGLTAKAEETEPHRFGDDGQCEVCEYQQDTSGCKHVLPGDGVDTTLELRILYLSEYGTNPQPERVSCASVDENNHRMTAAKALAGYFCTVCGKQIIGDGDGWTEVVSNVDELQPHVLDENGICRYCGYPGGVCFDVSGVKLVVGESYTPTVDFVRILENIGGQVDMYFTSGNESVFRVTDAESGRIEAVGEGTASLKCSLKLNGKVFTAFMNVTVVDGRPTSLSLSSSELTLGEGQLATLTALLAPAGSYANVTWTSSDSERVTVDGGRLQVLDSAFKTDEITGEPLPVTITASALDGALRAQCTVNVFPYPMGSDMRLDLGSGPIDADTPVELSQGDSAQAKLQLFDSDTSSGRSWTLDNSQVSFYSKERKYATVSSSGAIHILPATSAQLPEEEYTFTVTAIAYNGETASAEIKIVPSANEIRVAPGTQSPAANVTAATVGAGQTFHVAAQLLNGEDPMSGAVNFTVNTPEILEIVEQTSPGSPCTCEFKALKAGEARITAAASSSDSIKQTITVTVKEAPAGIALSSAGREIVNGVLTLGKGETATVSTAVFPSDAFGEVELAGDYADNACVDVAQNSETGELTLKAVELTNAEQTNGQPVAVKCRVRDNDRAPETTLYVEVVPAPQESDLKLEIDRTELGVGETAQVECGYSKPGVAWKQKLELVNDSRQDGKPTAQFDEETGVLTAENEGTVTLRMTAGEALVEKAITVKPAPTKVALKLAHTELGVGEKVEVTAGETALTPSDSVGEVTLSSNKPNIVSVEKVDGVWTLQALAAGSAKITAKSYNNKKSGAKTVTVKAAPTDIALSASELTLAKGESAQLTVTLTPKMCGGSMEWIYDDAQVEIAPVSGKTNVYTVTALQETGDFPITARVYDSLFEGKFIEAKATVHMRKAAAAENIARIAPDKLVLGVSEVAHLTAEFAPGFSRQVTWEIVEANPAGCVKITNQATGEIKGKKVASAGEAGTAKLVAVVDGARSEAFAEVRVVGKPTKVEFKTKVSKLGVGETFTPEIKPTGYNPQGVEGAPQIYSFSSSNTDVLTVDAKTGRIDAVAPGKATVTVKTYNKSAKMTVTVAEGLPAGGFEIDGGNLAIGDSLRLKANFFGGYANLTWPTTQSINQPGITVKKLSNEEIKITAKASATPGDITFDVAAAGYGTSQKVTVHVVAAYADALTVASPAKSVIGVNEKVALSAKGAGTISWKVQNPSPKDCVSVNSSGVVTGKKVGTAEIVAVAARDARNEEIMSDPVKITVIPELKKLTSDKSIAKLGVGEKQTLNLTMVGYTGDARDMNGVITATSSNEAVVKIDEAETDLLGSALKVALIGVKPGKSTVKIKTYNGKTIKMVIQVKDALPGETDLIPDSIEIAPKDKLTLKANLGGGYANLTWSELKPEADATGVTLVKKSNDTAVISAAAGAKGTYAFEVSAEGYSKRETCTITVAKAPAGATEDAISGMEVHFPKEVIGVGEKATAYVSYNPGFAGSVTWTSKNTKYATVNKTTGEIIGKKAGKAVIVATSFDSTSSKKYTARSEITVAAAPQGIAILNPVVALNPGDTYDLNAEITGYGGEELLGDSLYSYTSSKPGVIEVTDARNGMIEVAEDAEPGDSAVITVKTYNGKKATVAIRIDDFPVELVLPQALEEGLTLDRGQIYPLSATGKTEDGRNCVAHPTWVVDEAYAEYVKVENGQLIALKQTDANQTVPVKAQLPGNPDVFTTFQLTIKAVPVAEGPACNMVLDVEKTTLGVGETVVASFGFTADSGLSDEQMAYTLESSDREILDIRRKVSAEEGMAMAIDLPEAAPAKSDLYELVSGTKTGTAIITATALENGAQQKIEMQVSSAPVGIAIKSGGAIVNGKTITIGMYEDFGLEVEFTGYSGIIDSDAISCDVYQYIDAYFGVRDMYREESDAIEVHGFGELTTSSANWTCTGRAPGFATLTFSSYNGKKASVNIKVLPAPYFTRVEWDFVEGVTLTTPSLCSQVAPGDQLQFTATVDEGYRWAKGMRFEVEGPATITQDGLVKINDDAEPKAEVFVRAILLDYPDIYSDEGIEGLFAEYDLLVCTPLTEAQADRAEVMFMKNPDPADGIVAIGEGETTQAGVGYDNGSLQPDELPFGGMATWSSSDEGVVKVIDADAGMIQGVGVGEADIIATYPSGVQLSGHIKVLPPPASIKVSLFYAAEPDNPLQYKPYFETCYRICVEMFDENGNPTQGSFTATSSIPDVFPVYEFKPLEFCGYCGTDHNRVTGWCMSALDMFYGNYGGGSEYTPLYISIETHNGLKSKYVFKVISGGE